MRKIVRKLGKAWRLSRRASYRRGLRQNVAAAIEHEDALRSLELGALVDVGANVGQFSLLTRTLHPGVRIEAFEPLAEPAAKYARLFEGDVHARLHAFAAGEASGEAEIHVSGRADSSSLLPISAMQNEIFPGTGEVGRRVIKVARIDDVLDAAALPTPIMIKLDVQGFELSALKGMPNLLQAARYVYCEVSFLPLYEGQPLAHEIVAWLADRGFRFAGVYNPTFADDGRTVQADVLFEALTPV